MNYKVKHGKEREEYTIYQDYLLQIIKILNFDAVALTARPFHLHKCQKRCTFATINNKISTIQQLKTNYTYGITAHR